MDAFNLVSGFPSTDWKYASNQTNGNPTPFTNPSPPRKPVDFRLRVKRSTSTPWSWQNQSTEPHLWVLTNAETLTGWQVEGLSLKGWIIQHQQPWEQMCRWQRLSLQRRRLFGLLITASSSRLSFWWAKLQSNARTNTLPFIFKPRVGES